MRSLALSPYLYKYSGLGRPKYKDYIETSAKLNYVIQCVKSVKLHHESNGTPVSGQVIYMNRGVEYFDLIKEYLVKEVGFAEHEIGIIRSSMPKGKDKSWVQDRFLGRRFDEITREFSDIPDSERIKVLIGSATIQEGINLQTYGTVLYNCFLDWNPTSVIQLEGRIWRQGNQYSNVRIVNPMLEESMDIFMFQKLEEKTNRINVLFDYNGNTSTINLEEFNAKELKYALIKDPLRVAKLEAQEQKELLQDDLQGFRQILKSMDLFLKAKKEVESNVKNLLPFVKVHRDITHDDNFFMENPKILNNFILAILREQTFKDGTKLKDFTETEAKDLYYTYNWSEKQVNKIYFEPSKRSSAIYDDDITPHKFLIQEPYGIQVFQENVRIYQNFISKFSSTRNVKLNNATEINNFNLTIQKDINSINEKIDAFEEEDFLQNRAAEITAYRVKNGIESATVAERANQFASLNYLLDKKRVVMPTVAKVEKKPVISIQKYIDYAKNLRARQR